MKQRGKLLLHFLLSLAFLASAAFTFTAPAAATGTTLGSLTAGDTVNFAGYTWIVLNPSTGYLLMDGYYNPSYQFSDNVNYHGSNIEALLNGESGGTGGFYGSLPPADQALIQLHTWSLEDVDGGTALGSVNDYIGLIDDSDWYNNSKWYWSTGFLASPTYAFWTLTPTGDLTQLMIVNQGELQSYPPSGSFAVCPALYLSNDVSISGSGTSGDPYAVIVPAPAIASNPTAAPGTASGDTAITVTSLNTSGDTLAVEVSGSSIATPNVGAAAPTGSNVINPYTSGSNLAAAANDYVGVFELDGNGGVVAFSQIGPLTSTEIDPTPAPSLTTTPTAAAGTASGDTAITVTLNNSGDTVAVEVYDSSINTPNVGAAAPTGSSVTNPYTSGSNLAAAVGDYVGAYELDSSGNVVAFSQIQLTAGDIYIAPGISVGPQSGTLTAGTAGTATFTATTSNISGGTVVTVNWCNSSGGNASTPTGLSASGSNVSSNSSTITVTATSSAASGTYYFTASSDGATSSMVAVTVSPAGGSGGGGGTYSGLSISPTSTTNIGPLNNVTISDPGLSTGEYVYYNTGEEPSAVSNAIYASSLPVHLTVSVSETVYAQVYGSGNWSSAVWETYTIDSAAPVINTPVYAGSDVSVSGTAAPGAAIVLYDNGTEKGTATANSSGVWTISGLTLASGDVLTATAQVSGQSTSSASSSVTVATSSSSSGSSGGGGSTTVANNTGTGTITSSVGGTVWLNNEAGVTIPKGALQGSANATISVASASTPPAPPAGDTLVGAYEFTVNGGGYTFNSPVTLTFTFDPSKIPGGDVPVVEYYDNTTDSWVLVTGSTVNGDTITVTVDHFTTFAVMAVPQTATVTTAPAAASTFSDVPSSFWGYDAISSLSGKGIVSGYPDGSFKPNNNITRAEFATMLVKALGLTASGTDSFTDVAPSNWCYGSVNTAVYAGLVSGMGNGQFAPNAPITREEMAVMVAKALGSNAPTVTGAELSAFSDGSTISSWAVKGMEVSVKADIVSGMDGKLAPQANATRAQAAAMIFKLLGVLGK